MRLMVNATLAGSGFTLGLEETFRYLIEKGELVAVLEAFCPPFPGFFLYYPDRRNHALQLRAFVDHVKSHAAKRPAS